MIDLSFDMVLRATRLLLAFVFCFTAATAQKHRATFYFEKGDEAMRSQAYKTALAHFNECLRLDPFYMEAYYYRAQVRDELGDKQGALTDYNIYLDSKPHDTDALLSRAQLRYHYRQWAMAKEDFLKLLKAPPGETKTIFFNSNSENKPSITSAQSDLKASVLNYLGLVETRLHNHKSAVHYLDSAVLLDPQNPEFIVNRGWAHQINGDTATAIRDYTEVLKVDPQNSVAKHNLATVASPKNTQETEQLLNDAILRVPDEPRYFTARGLFYLRQGKTQQAMEDFDAAIRLDPKEPDPWIRRALLKQKLKDFDGALADFTEGIKLKDDRPSTWVSRGMLMMDMNRLKDAVEDFSLALVHQPDLGRAYLLRARALQKMGKLAEACADLVKAEQLQEKILPDEKKSICK